MHFDMHIRAIAAAASAGLAVSTTPTATAQPVPQMGGPMIHAYVVHENGRLSAAMDPGRPVLLNYGASYEGPAAVLNGTMYNAQYGWLADFIDPLPTSLSIVVEQLSATPGLMVYEGGMMMDIGELTFAPIFGTDGSSTEWTWSRRMTHNWYAVTAPGAYEATYRVFVRDADGRELTSYGSPTYTFGFTAVPAPGAAAAFALAAGLSMRRRR